MFPIGDDNSQRRITPYVTFGLIALNVIVFLLELQFGDGFIETWAFVPARFTAAPAADAATLLSAVFMHGGFMHLGGNMLYLWIFGDNVEDRFGHVPFLIFYLLAGLGATAAQYLVNTQSMIPNVGASGAIAGVLGAYILMFPQSKVRVLVVNTVLVLPAPVVLGFWIALQAMSGAGSIMDTSRGDSGGVAYMAHVGGFVAGFVLTFLFRGRGPAGGGMAA